MVRKFHDLSLARFFGEILEMLRQQIPDEVHALPC
jgi:hypothetical protein